MSVAHGVGRCIRSGMRRSPVVGVLLLALVQVLSGACTKAPPPSPRTHDVAIAGFGFDPAQLHVAVGDTVVWHNRDVVPHTATAAGAEWDSGSLVTGASWRLVVAGPTDVAYVCALHPSMTGTLIVN